MQGRFLEKIETCLDCKVLATNIDPAAMKNTLAELNSQIKVYKEIAEDRDRELERTGLELAIGLSEVFEALRRISTGDPEVSISETSEIELIRRLKHEVNVTAKNIGEIVGQSHEFAMGLAEHFDVLHRASRGDLGARVLTESKTELLESLRKVTNGMIESISKEMTRENSERESYERKLQLAAQEWRATFDTMPYGVLLLDADLNIMRANKYISKLYEVSLYDIVGKKCGELNFGNDSAKEFCNMLKKRDVPVPYTFEYFDKNLNKFFMLHETPVFEKEIVKSYVLSFIDISELKDKEKKLIDSKDAFFNMLKELDFSYKEAKGLYESLIHSFINAIDAKSPWTKGHSERVTHYAMSIGQEMKLSEQDMERLRTAALLHDVGKIGTYDVILEKPGKLTEDEFALIRTHPARGEDILRPIKQFRELLPIIRHHHERLDGKGYPDGLKNGEIPFLSKIITIADSYDSMTSDRPYRPSPPREYALRELKRCCGSQFDPDAVEAFMKVLAKWGKEDSANQCDACRLNKPSVSC